MTFNTAADTSTNKHHETFDTKITPNTLHFWRDSTAVPDLDSIHHITAAHKYRNDLLQSLLLRELFSSWDFGSIHSLIMWQNYPTHPNSLLLSVQNKFTRTKLSYSPNAVYPATLPEVIKVMSCTSHRCWLLFIHSNHTVHWDGNQMLPNPLHNLHNTDGNHMEFNNSVSDLT